MSAKMASEADSNSSGDASELEPDSMSSSVKTGSESLVQGNAADVGVRVIADTVLEEKMSSDSGELESSLPAQDEKERPLLKKSRPRKKATLQDYLPFS